MQKRIIISILVSISVIIICLGLISFYHIRNSIQRSYDERLDEARILAAAIDHIVEENLTRLYDISLTEGIDLRDGDWAPEREALQAAYRYSLFSDGVFLVDRRGTVLLTYPPRDNWSTGLLDAVPVTTAVTGMRPVVSNVYSLPPSGRKVIFALVPLRNRAGEVVGAAGGLIDPTNYQITRILSTLTTSTSVNIDIVDGAGIVIASNRPSNILTGIDHNRFLSGLIAEKKGVVSACHRCHVADATGSRERSEDILVFTPMNAAPWGIAVRVPRNQVYAPSAALQQGFIALAVISLAASFILALGMSKSIVKPVRELIRATDLIARGDLAGPVHTESADEIQTLSEHFDTMRTRLRDSLESIQRQNTELEVRVQDRTRSLQRKQRINEGLLRKLITSQEDERKRIARELHDDSLQTLSATLMNIEMCRLHPEQVTPEKIAKIRDAILMVTNEMTRVIQNLRPTVLDDLGFEAAIVWLVDHNLRSRKIDCQLNLQELDEDRLPPELQVTLFRIIQEATTNIARHSGAQNVFLHVKNDVEHVTVIIEDDGIGFDTGSVFENTLTGRGLGILGMKERAAQVGGTVKVCSAVGSGTTLLCTAPISREE